MRSGSGRQSARQVEVSLRRCRHTLADLSISAYVWPSNSKIGSQPGRRLGQLVAGVDSRPGKLKRGLPKSAGPLAGTILPGVRPWKMSGSCPGPAEKANVQTAKADLSSYAASRLLRPVWPNDSRNHFLDIDGMSGSG